VTGPSWISKTLQNSSSSVPDDEPHHLVIVREHLAQLVRRDQHASLFGTVNVSFADAHAPVPSEPQNKIPPTDCFVQRVALLAAIATAVRRYFRSGAFQ